MSAAEQLQNADARLAAQIDAVTAAVAAIGVKTDAARRRFAEALDAARQRLQDAMRQIATDVELTLDCFANAAGCGMLAVPEPLVYRCGCPAKPSDKIEAFCPEHRKALELPAAPETLGVETPQTPDAPEAAPAPDRPSEATAGAANGTPHPFPFRCLSCGVDLTEDANHCQPCYEREFGTPANPMPLAEALADPAGFVAGMAEERTTHRNGKTRKGRKRP